jgi:hypothetical protein
MGRVPASSRQPRPAKCIPRNHPEIGCSDLIVGPGAVDAGKVGSRFWRYLMSLGPHAAPMRCRCCADGITFYDLG